MDEEFEKCDSCMTVTVQQAAALVGVSRPTLEKHLKAGELPSVVVGRRRLILKTDLKDSGTPIPINDVWIAAHAMETGSVLISYDTHFTMVAGLRLWNN